MMIADPKRRTKGARRAARKSSRTDTPLPLDENVSPPLDAPADGVPPSPPVQTLAQELPFGDLTWENFERLCYRLAKRETDIEDVRRYGRQGQAQQGIDVYARKTDGRYEVWQAKRHETYSVTKLRKAIGEFLKGAWVEHSDRLIIAVQASLADTKIQDEIETQTAKLKKSCIQLDVQDGQALSDRLRNIPELVHEFFGRAWVKAFFGDEAAQSLLDTLDGEEFSHVREQLANVYNSQFAILDQGIVPPVTSAGHETEGHPSLLERYIDPDILVREQRRMDASAPADTSAREDDGHSSITSAQPRPPQTAGTDQPQNFAIDQLRRVTVETWVADNDHLAIVADAGLGKSTFLRCLVLDLLGDQTRFPKLAGRWGNRLPLLIPFARWAHETAKVGGQVSLTTVLRATLQSLLTTGNLLGLVDRAIEEGRVLLLIDGLDEWTAEQAARTAFTTLLTFVEAHGIPTLVTGRPRGLQKIGNLSHNWRVGELAPLSLDQQKKFASVWFTRHMPLAGSDQPAIEAVQWETDRFFRELRNEAGLHELSATPLLLLGLISLVLRGHALPQNRVQALDKLVEIFLEEHPQSRATAAGDVDPRFTVLRDSKTRRDTLAALALASHSEGGDAGYPIVQAQSVLAAYLDEVKGFKAEQARQGASELLAVNAETVGLLIEKAAGEVGFAHARIEEYLAALAIQSWPFKKSIDFARSHCGDPRWRNTLSDLISICARPDEIDSIIAAIGDVDLDAVGSANRRLLLATVIFTTPQMAPATASRLADECFAGIEGGGWPGERTDLLRAVLNGFAHPTLSTKLEQQLKSWAPRRTSYMQPFFAALSDWPAAADHLEAVWRGLSDEESSSRLSAAKTLAAVYRGDAQVKTRLTSLIQGECAFRIAAVALIALVEGWARDDDAIRLAEEARTSNSPLFRSIGIFGRVCRDAHEDEDRTEILNLLEDGSDLDWYDEVIAREALFSGWPNDPEVISRCLSSRREMPRKTSLRHDVAQPYLLSCSSGDEKILQWLQQELDEDHPFGFLFGWSGHSLLPFAEADSTIADQIVETIMSDKMRLSGPYVWAFIAEYKDPRLRDYAIANVLAKSHMEVYWNLKPLLAGWRGDPKVEALIKEVAEWPDARLGCILSLLPEIILDRLECRARLLAFSADDRIRYDFIAEALVDLGCNGSDDEAVKRIFEGVGKKYGQDPTASLIRGFWTHPEVRSLAKKRLSQRDAPLEQIVERYSNDPELRPDILAYGGSLSTSLRYLISEAARINADRQPALEALLAGYDQESDADLKVSLAADWFELVMARGNPNAEIVDSLLEDADAVGHDYSIRRAAAFAGLTVVGAADRFAMASRSDEPMRISLGDREPPSATMMQLVVKHWSELEEAFNGATFDRLGLYSSKPEHIWEGLAPYIGLDEAVYREFVRFCEETEEPLGVAVLQALARARPRSQLLEAHCWRLIESEKRQDTPQSARAPVEAAHILRDHFPAREDVRSRLLVHFESKPRRISNVRPIALALYVPEDPIFNCLALDQAESDEYHYDWPTIIYIAALTKPVEIFLDLVLKMIAREWRSVWDMQERMNSVILDRLARDDEAAAGLVAELGENATTDIWASLPKLLAAAGLLDPTTRQYCLDKLNAECSRNGIPSVGFDVLANEVRSVSHSLMDVLTKPTGV